MPRQEPLQTLDACVEPRLSPRNTSARNPRPADRRHCRRHAQPRFAHRALHSSRLRDAPGIEKNKYIAPGGALRSSPARPTARAPENRATLSDRHQFSGKALACRRPRCPHAERTRRARGVVLDQFGQIVHQFGGRDDPAQPPAGHQPRLRERVRPDNPVVARGEIEKRRRGTGLALLAGSG